MRAVRRAIVATVRNEEGRLAEFLASLERQTFRPDIVVVTDGGSTDRTPQLLEAFTAHTSLPFRWASAPGNRSVGRNAAIRLAEADVIACTDASLLDPAWFERIVAPIERGEADFVAGWYELQADRPKDRVIGLLTQYSLEQIRPTDFLPSSRSVAFTRSLWERAGGYPEAFEGNEDSLFDLAVERLHPRKVFAPNAVVRWRPAASVRGVYRQQRKYAVGDGQAGIFLTTRTRYAAYFVVYIGGIVLALIGIVRPIAWSVLLILGAGYILFRARKILRAGLWPWLPYAALLVVTWDVSLMVGYARGRLDRLRFGGNRFRF
ncbi:MAG: glycosyltransferase [Methanobacteriota archaeon]|nr:MAG: glycosyltransferase [Euryarchaeota archaeon]